MFSSSLSIPIPVINTDRLSTPKKKAPPLLSDDTKVGSWSDVIIDKKTTNDTKHVKKT